MNHISLVFSFIFTNITRIFCGPEHDGLSDSFSAMRAILCMYLTAYSTIPRIKCHKIKCSYISIYYIERLLFITEKGFFASIS